MNQNTPLTLATTPLNETIELVRNKWLTFEKQTNPSFFQTWAWLGPWWHNSGKFFKPDLFAVSRNDNLVALAIFTPVNTRRHFFITSRQYHLNESRTGEYDFTIEHNGILSSENNINDILRVILGGVISNRKIDEIVISGVNKKNYDAYINAGRELGLHPRDIYKSKYCYVDLDRLQKDNIDFITTLSSNTRSKIRRSIKAYESTFGEVKLQEASNLEQAMDYLQQLKILHQEHWESREKPGSFANARWECFIKDIVRSQFANNKIQLLRISAGETDIGYILSLTHNGYINMLQSGFKYHSDNKLKPGYVSHYMAIQHNVEMKNHTYDFLAGESQYKDSLSENHDYLYWFTLQRRKPEFILEDVAVGTINFLRKIKHKFNLNE